MQWLADVFSDWQGSLFELVLQPLMFHMGLGNLLPEGYNATGWLLVGLIDHCGY